MKTLLILAIGIFVAPLAVWGGPPLQNDFESLPHLRQHSTRRNNYLSKKEDFDKTSEIGGRYKLNDTFIPENYEVKLLVILDDDPEIGDRFTAPGSVRISITPTQDTSTIILHANLLRVIDESITVSYAFKFNLNIGFPGIEPTGAGGVNSYE